MCDSRGSGDGDESGRKDGALMRDRVAAIDGLVEAFRVRFRVWSFKVGSWGNLGFHDYSLYFRV